MQVVNAALWSGMPARFRARRDYAKKRYLNLNFFCFSAFSAHLFASYSFCRYVLACRYCRCFFFCFPLRSSLPLLLQMLLFFLLYASFSLVCPDTIAAAFYDLHFVLTSLCCFFSALRFSTIIAAAYCSKFCSFFGIIFFTLDKKKCRINIKTFDSQVNGTTSAAKKVTVTKRKQNSPPKLQRYPAVVDKVPVKRGPKKSAAQAKRVVPSVSTPRGIQPILEPPKTLSRQKRPPTKVFSTPAKQRKVFFARFLFQLRTKNYVLFLSF